MHTLSTGTKQAFMSNLFTNYDIF